MDLCRCHSQPLSWCPDLKDRTVVTIHGPDVGVVHQADHPSECGICGDPIGVGETVVRLPAPTWAHGFAHAWCSA